MLPSINKYLSDRKPKSCFFRNISGANAVTNLKSLLRELSIARCADKEWIGMMTLQDLKQLAHSGIEPQEPLNCAERAFYYAAKDIYAMFYDKRITQQESAERMSKAVLNYKIDMQQLRNGNDALQRFGELYKNIELATSAYRKNRTLENADKMLEAIYGATMRKDDANEDKT